MPDQITSATKPNDESPQVKELHRQT